MALDLEEQEQVEELKAWWKQHGGMIAAVVVAVAVGFIGWQGWRWYQARQDQAAAVEYITAMTLADATAAGSSDASRGAAINAFATLATRTPDGYATLARLHEAALKAQSGDLPGAAALWDRVAGDSAADPLLRDLASLMWAEHQIDAGDPAALEARLKALAAPANPWRSLAEEQLALLDLRLGKADAAKATLRRLAQDTGAPNGVRGRANGLLTRLGG